MDVYTPESQLPSDFPKDLLVRIEYVLATEWSIFKLESSKVKTVIMELCKEFYTEDSLIFSELVGIEALCDEGFRKRNCITMSSTWELFMSSIKNKNRFHSNHINLPLLEKLFANPSLQLTIPRNFGKSIWF